MSDQHFLDFLPENSGAVVTNWREIREKLHEAADHAATEEQRVAVLAAYKAGGRMHRSRRTSSGD